MPDSNIATLPAIATHPLEGVARFGSGGSRTSVAGSCAVLWPATVMFVLTGNAGSALAVAGVAWVLRHVWEGGARSAAERMRDHGGWALRSGHYRRARRIYERLWAVHPTVRARFSGYELRSDRLNYATSLLLVGQSQRAFDVLTAVPTAFWENTPEIHGPLGALCRRLAERLLEARQAVAAREMLDVSEACARWRAARNFRRPPEELAETGWLWLRLGGTELAIECFLRALQGANSPIEVGGATPPPDTGPYRVVVPTASQDEPLRDDSLVLGLAEAYLQHGRYQAALNEFSGITEHDGDPGQDSPVARGRAERGRARALVLLGRHREAVGAYERALSMDLQGDLRFGGAVHDCLELTRVYRHLKEPDRAAQALEQAKVVAVRADHHHMIEAFISGSPFSVARALWCDVPVPVAEGVQPASGRLRITGEEPHEGLSP